MSFRIAITLCLLLFAVIACKNNNTHMADTDVVYPYTDTFVTSYPVDSGGQEVPMTVYIRHVSKDSQTFLGSEPVELDNRTYQIVSADANMLQMIQETYTPR
jgi:hypothetical protein